ncbi:hypothetical protein HN873_051083, partial [Arachis hypogaea]
MRVLLKDLGLFLVNKHQDCVAEKSIKMEKKFTKIVSLDVYMAFPALHQFRVSLRNLVSLQ